MNSAMMNLLRCCSLALSLVLIAFPTHAQTATDACGYNAGNQYPVGTACNLLTFNKPLGFTATYTATGCTGGSNVDAWGWFTATSNYINLTFDPASSHRSILHLYTGACGSLTQVGCMNSGGNGNNANLSIEVVEGQNYMVRIQRHNDDAAMNGSFCAWRPAFPANDDPCGAVVLTVNATCTNTATTNRGATATTGVAAPSCGDYQGGDVWYRFVAPANGAVTIRTAASGLTDSGIALYSAAACGGAFTELACTPNGNGNMGQLGHAGLTPGQAYYVRVWGDGNASGTFNICVVSLAHDEPCDAVNLTVNASCSNTSTTNLYATASPSVPDPPCGNYSGGDAWYRFTGPANGAVTIRTGANGLTNSAIALYSAGSCSAGITLLSCAAGGNGAMGQIQHYGLTPGVTYYVRVWGENGASGTFNICVFTPAVVNDEPCGAIDLTIGSSCTYTSRTNAGASASSGIPAPGCGNAAFNDVWFRFTAPTNGLVTFRVTAGTLGNPQMAVYSANSCTGPFTLIKCDNASGPGNAPFMTLTPLEVVPGGTYYLRVWGNNGSTGTFNLCSFTAPAGGDCTYVLRMWDSQSDGWSGSYVTIQVGAGAPVDYTLPNGSEDVAYITVSTGEMVTLSYTAVGSAEGEIRYALQLINGPLYLDGPSPGTGPRWAGVANCQSAAPLASDCIGGSPICDAQQISANPSNTGLANDLNLHTRGCLSNNERQGLWYRFTVSASGTLGFTLTPDNLSDDYDFALYGPYGSFACPPAQAPIRCNYSGITGATGVSSAGTNPSEGAGGSKWSSLLPVTIGQSYLLYVSNWTQSGLAFNLGWQLTGGSSLDCTLLPVELLSFTGAPVPEGIRLDWLTASELNSAYFAVERMDETGAFQQIGTVAAAGYSSTSHAYEHLDALPLPGFNHYRLKMVDADGTEKLSDLISVANRYGSFVGSLFPNPAREHISFAADQLPEGIVFAAVSDASGRIVLDAALPVSEGSNILTIPLGNLEKGYYVLHVSTPAGSPIHTGRFVVE